jgi:hypothetical protein
MKPTVLRTGCQRGVRLEIALVERRHKQKRTAAYYLVSWLEIGVRQMSGNKLMILKLKLTIETDNRTTVGVPEVIFS